MTPGLFSGPVSWQALLSAVIPTFLLAALGAIIAKRFAERGMKAALGEQLAMSSPLVQGPLRLVTLAAFILVASVLLFPAFELVGLTPRAGVPIGVLAAWAFANGLKVLTIGLIAYALVRTIALLVRRFEYQVSQGTTVDALERAKRARTLGSLVEKMASVAIWTVSLLMILDQFEVNITPVLTGAGIAGLAVGFGAQTLVRDIISGFFLILEDQVRVGDVASINGVGGLVEQLNLRTIVLRDEEGSVHVFPNGAITTLANRSKDFSYYVITLPLPYTEDADRVAAILRDVGEDLRTSPAFGPFILAPLEILGLDAFGDWAMQLKLRVKTVPQRQWDVGRELRRRIRIAFRKADVRVPFPAIGAAAHSVDPRTVGEESEEERRGGKAIEAGLSKPGI
jgi:small conductance mechanosensitive channel